MTTPNHGFESPTAASANWKANFDYLDTHLLLSGLKSDRPTAGTTDRLYMATDEGVIYRDDGASWESAISGAAGSVEVEDDGIVVTGGATTIDFASYLDVTDGGSGHVTIGLSVDPAAETDLSAHTGDTSNPHSVTTAQIGALADNAGTVTETNLAFDPATQSELDDHTGDAANPHGVTASQVSAIPEADRGVGGGVAELDSDATIVESQVPSIAITDTFVVADESERLALNQAETGDVAIQEDEAKSYILQGTDPSISTDWKRLKSPDSNVESVFGRTGAVTAQSGDYTHSQLAAVGADDHHTRYADEEAQDAVGSIVDGTLVYDDAMPALGVADASIGEAKLSFDPATQSELDAHAGSSGAHHTRYSDAEAVTAVNAEASLSVDISGDADTVDGEHASAFMDADRITVSSSAPSTPNTNDIWFDTS